MFAFGEYGTRGGAAPADKRIGLYALPFINVDWCRDSPPLPQGSGWVEEARSKCNVTKAHQVVGNSHARGIVFASVASIRCLMRSETSYHALHSLFIRQFLAGWEVSRHPSVARFSMLVARHSRVLLLIFSVIQRDEGTVWKKQGSSMCACVGFAVSHQQEFLYPDQLQGGSYAGLDTWSCVRNRP